MEGIKFTKISSRDVAWLEREFQEQEILDVLG